MTRKRKSGIREALGVALLAHLAMLAAVPMEAWVGLSLLVLGGIACYYFVRSKYSNKSSALVQTEESPSNTMSKTDLAKLAPRQKSASAPVVHFVERDVPVTASAQSDGVERVFRIPTAPQGYGAANWIPKEKTVNVAGITLPQGLVYVGQVLPTSQGNTDPSLIDPTRAVAKPGNYSQAQMGYWPSYSEISAGARRTYLEWLADGRRNPEADIGNVFLFFYGLERRAIIDAAQDPVARAELPVLAQELRRLLAVYGDASASFRRYATDLLDWIEMSEHPAKLYEQPVPTFAKTWEIPWYLRLALGQTAVDAQPVPAPLALAWAKHDPNKTLRTPAVRCAEQFDTLFIQKYFEAHGAGLLLPRNRTKLKMVYRPASAGFRGYQELRLNFGETPDVTALTAPLQMLQRIVDAATTELEAYSRFIGKNLGDKFALEGLLHLPASLWPDGARSALNGLKDRMGSGMVTLTFQDLLAGLDARSIFTRDKTLALARTLESVNIGLEPDVLGGAKAPKPTDAIVLFTIPPGEALARSSAPYQAAVLTLQLAAALASSDEDFSSHEISYLREQIQSWNHLTPNHIRRLLAHLRLLMSAPLSLSVLKKKLEPLDAAAREIIAAFMATVAQSDGAVTPAEIKLLEKLYTALGVAPNKIFSTLNAEAVGETHATTGRASGTGFQLDSVRIAALQRDTEKVSALLANIFKEEEEEVQGPPQTELEFAAESTAVQGILGLAEPYQSLARLLQSRPQWSRDELLDVAADLELMLDGALEHINEAAFEHYNMALTEGHDPLTINAETLEMIQA